MKIFFSLTFVLISFSIFAQNITGTHTHLTINERLFEVFERNYLEKLRATHPFFIQRWNYYLDHSWYIADLPPEKAKAAYPVVQITDLDNINILLLEREQNLRKDWNRRVVYAIEGLDKALVYYAGKEFNRRLNDYLERKYPKSDWWLFFKATIKPLFPHARPPNWQNNRSSELRYLSMTINNSKTAAKHLIYEQESYARFYFFVFQFPGFLSELFDGQHSHYWLRGILSG
jgi:hypothetical protein